VECLQHIEDGGELVFIGYQQNERLGRVGDHLQTGIQIGLLDRHVLYDADG